MVDYLDTSPLSLSAVAGTERRVEREVEGEGIIMFLHKSSTNPSIDLTRSHSKNSL